MTELLDLGPELTDGVLIDLALEDQRFKLPRTLLQLLSPLLRSIFRTLSPCESTILIIPDVDFNAIREFIQVIENFKNKSFQKVLGLEEIKRLDKVFELFKIDSRFFKINLHSKEKKSMQNVSTDAVEKLNTTENQSLSDERPIQKVKEEPDEDKMNENHLKSGATS